jgi:hypothetical protein
LLLLLLLLLLIFSSVEAKIVRRTPLALDSG